MQLPLPPKAELQRELFAAEGVRGSQVGLGSGQGWGQGHQLGGARRPSPSPILTLLFALRFALLLALLVALLRARPFPALLLALAHLVASFASATSPRG